MDEESRRRLQAVDANRLIELFLDGHQSENTRRTYAAGLQIFVAWCHDVAAIEPHLAEVVDINRYAEYLQRREHRPSTVEGYLASVKSFFRFLRQWRADSPFDDPRCSIPEGLSVGRRVQTIPLSAHAALLREALSIGGVDAAAIGLLAVNALKTSEVTASDAADVSRQRDRAWLKLPSRGKGAETPLLDEVGEAVLEVWNGRDSGPLLRNQAGRRLTPHNLTTICQRLGQKLGIREKVSPGLLRNTAAIIAVNAGISHPGLRSMLGISGSRTERYFDYQLPGNEHGAALVLRRIRPESNRHELLDQVDAMLAEPETNPIAPVVVAGAALEQHLRAQLSGANAEPTGRPNLRNYVNKLRSLSLIDERVQSQLLVWVRLRNDAAHGHPVSHGDAVAMANGIRQLLAEARSTE